MSVENKSELEEKLYRTIKAKIIFQSTLKSFHSSALYFVHKSRSVSILVPQAKLI